VAGRGGSYYRRAAGVRAGRRRVQGDRAFRKLIRKMPDAIRDEMVAMMETAGDQILAAQRADVARRTGALAAALTKRVLRGSMRLRVGLLGKAINRRLFYARIVEVGRRAQTVTVSRRGAHLAAGGRRIGRRQRALESGVRGVYQLRVPAKAPRPFVRSARTKALRDTMGGRLAGFWDRTLAKAAQGATDD